MNRNDCRKTARSVRRLLEKDAMLPPEEVSAAFVGVILEAGAAASGLPLKEWSWKPELSRHYTELKDDVRRRIAKEMGSIRPEDWRQRPELAGWMYQYMLEERKHAVFSELKQGTKVRAEDLPAVTQLFTPQWIAAYLAQNAIGRLWLDGQPGAEPLAQWTYFDREAQALPSFGHGGWDGAGPSPLGWRIMDPACGCGHLLAAAFDVLMDVYQQQSIAPREAVRRIIRFNVTGTDIDLLSVQICSFVLLMKGAAYDPSILSESVSMNIHALTGPNREIGSLLRAEAAEQPGGWKVLGEKYDAVITNPPYLGRRNMGTRLSQYLDLHYPRARNDLFAAFLERAVELTRAGGYHAVINQHSWMYLTGYEELRRSLLKELSLVSLLHLGPRAFEDIGGEVVQTVCMVLSNRKPEPGTQGAYWKLTNQAAPHLKEQAFQSRSRDYLYIACQSEFARVPGCRIAYSLPFSWNRLFEGESLGRYCAVKKGMDTGNNSRFVRCWYEVPAHTRSWMAPSPEHASWFPYAKGGGGRRWYGNHDYVVDWSGNGQAIRQEPRSNLRNEMYFGNGGITWSTVTTGRPSFRLLEPGFLFDNGGSCIFPLGTVEVDRYAVLAYLNSEIAVGLLEHLNPTLNIQPGDVARLPADAELLRSQELSRLGRACTAIAMEEWEESERSWSFTRHPMAAIEGLPLEQAYSEWSTSRTNRRMRLLELEREITQSVAKHFGLEQGLRLGAAAGLQDWPELSKDLGSLMSYGVGWMLGRYGRVNKDITGDGSGSILVIGPELLDRLNVWLEQHWGREHLERNRKWLADGLKCAKDETPEERLQRYFKDEWYKEHQRAFRGKPLYVKFTSGSRGALAAYAIAVELNFGMIKQLLQVTENGLHSAPADMSIPDREELTRYADKLRMVLLESREELHPDACARTRIAAFAELLEMN